MLRTSALIPLLACLALAPAAEASHPTGTLIVDNERGKTVRVYVDDDLVGEVDGDSERRFRVELGRHEVLLRSKKGRVVESAEVSVTRSRDARIEASADHGRVIVENPHDEQIEIYVDGKRFARLEPGAEQRLRLPTGRHTIEARYTQFGQTRVLTRQSLEIGEGARQLSLPSPRDTLVAVTNNTGRAATVVVDGRPDGAIAKGQVRYIEVPVGQVRLELEREGRALDTFDLHARPFAEKRVVGQPPKTGLVSVQSDSGRTTRLIVDGEVKETIRPFGRASIEVPAGTRRLVIKDSGGAVLFSARLVVDRYEATTLAVGAGDAGATACHQRPSAGHRAGHH